MIKSKRQQYVEKDTSDCLQKGESKARKLFRSARMRAANSVCICGAKHLVGLLSNALGFSSSPTLSFCTLNVVCPSLFPVSDGYP
jgi:hypothetical protein